MASIRSSSSIAGPPREVAGQRTALRKVRKLLSWVVLLIATGLFIYPLIWLLSASFKPQSEVFDNRLIPTTPTLQNYLDVWQSAPMALWMGNTILVTVLASLAVTFSSSLVAWGFAYYRFPGRDALFFLILATMMLPGVVTLIPTYLIWDALGQVGTLTPLWAQNLFGSAFYIFLIRQFFLGLPRQVFEAARVDGASDWRLYWNFALPLCKPAIVVTLVFETQAAWTDLMRPLIYLRDETTFTIPRGLKALVDQFGFAGNWHWELIVTASVIATIPMIIVFFIAQRHILEGAAPAGPR